jgi:hypothetical protein
MQLNTANKLGYIELNSALDVSPPPAPPPAGTTKNISSPTLYSDKTAS